MLGDPEVERVEDPWISRITQGTEGLAESDEDCTFVPLREVRYIFEQHGSRPQHTHNLDEAAPQPCTMVRGYSVSGGDKATDL